MRRRGSPRTTGERSTPNVESVRGWVTAAAVFAAAFLLWNVLAASIPVLLLLFTAMLLAAALQPIVNRLSTRTSYGAAVGITFGVAIVAIAGLGFVLLQPVAAELGKLIAAIPSYAGALQTQLASAQRYIENDQTARQLASALANGASGAASSVGLSLLGGPKLVATAIGDGLLIVLLAIGWMLTAGELEQFVLGLIPPKPRENWRTAFADISVRLGAYVQGVVINGAVVGVVMSVSLAILGVPYALLLGFISAIFQAIPMVGGVISGPIVLLVALATSGWEKTLIVFIIFTVVQILDGNVLTPIIFGQRVQLSFLLIIFSTVVGGTLLGISGAFLAVPAAAALQVIIVRILAPAIRSTH
jgi:predicted PurR-regulated permease PerM